MHELATKHSELLEQITELKTKLVEAENVRLFSSMEARQTVSMYNYFIFQARSELSDSYGSEKLSLVKEIEKLNSKELQLTTRIASLEQQLAVVGSEQPLEQIKLEDQDIQKEEENYENSPVLSL